MHQTIPHIKNGLCIGIDLHKCQMTIAILDAATGDIRFERIACKCRDKIIAFFENLPKPHIVAIESVGFYRWLWDLLEPICSELVLADATQCRALAGRRIKTDREDAANVAELLAAGRLPTAWAPPTHIAALRDVTRHRHYLSQQHARVLHRVKSIMNQVNRPGPARLKADGLLRYIKAQRDKLPEQFVDQLEMAVDELILLERQLARIDIRLRETLGDGPFQPLADRLMSFPGVKYIIAATIIAEIGDFTRFERRDAISRYAGLDPRTFSSDTTTRTGRISKTGSPDLRWALVQAAWVAVRCDPAVKSRWLRLRKRMGGKRAIIAIARGMLRWMWAAERDRTNYLRRAA